MSSKIEWTNETWNPVTGCTPCSLGCTHCYAKRMAQRLAGRYGYPEAPHHFDVTLHPSRLGIPLMRRKPTMYFVCSMSDLFHKDVPDNFIFDILEIVAQCPQHTFQVLTKRPKRMAYLWRNADKDAYPNLWLGVSIENQAAADERIPLLLQTPAAVHYVSIEPYLSGIDLTRVRVSSMEMLNALTGISATPHSGPPRYHSLDWVICGSESGPGARPMDEDWVRDLRDQCWAAGVSFFYKQKLVNGRKVSMPALNGRIWDEMPKEITCS